MNRFGPALRRTARELDLPPPLRDAILLELAADLEAAYLDQRRRGRDEEEAARRAEEMILGSSEVVRRLARLHADSWRGWSDDVGTRLSRGGGLVLLAVAVVPMLLAAARVAISELVHAPASPLIWLLSAVGATIATLVGLEGARLVRGRWSSGNRPTLLLLSAVAPALGLLALALGLRSVAIALASESAEVSSVALLAERVGRDAALFAVGLLLGISGALSWFVLRSRASVLAAREADALLSDGSAPELGTRSGAIPLMRRRRA